MEEFFCALSDRNSDDAILSWQNTMLINVIFTHIPLRYEFHDLRTTNTVQEKTNPKALEEDELARKRESFMFEYDRHVRKYVIKVICIDMDLSE